MKKRLPTVKAELIT